LIATAMNAKIGSAALRDIAYVYETLGRFLSDLDLLSEVHFKNLKMLYFDLICILRTHEMTCLEC